MLLPFLGILMVTTSLFSLTALLYMEGLIVFQDIVFLQASTKNIAGTVLQLFLEAVDSYNLPSTVRSDRGLENIVVGRFMIGARCPNRGCIITGYSVHNQRIERLWREVNRVVVSRFLNIFLYLEQCGVLDPESERHLYCLHLVYLPLINTALRELIST